MTDRSFARKLRLWAALGLLLGGATTAPAWGALIPASVGLNFTGTTFGNGSTNIPPDTMGSVGPDHIVEMINGRFRVYSKTDGGELASQSLNSFWDGAGAVRSGSAFDPRVTYDPFSNRFYATAADNSFDDNHFLLAVSETSDATGNWFGFAIDSDPANRRWADYPMLGYTPDTVYVSANMFGQTGQNISSQVNIMAIPKADLLASTPTDANVALLENVRLTTLGNPQAAIDLDNTMNLMPSVWAGTDRSAYRTNLVHDGQSLTLGGTTAISMTLLNQGPDGDQPGDKQNIDNTDDRYPSNLVLQNGIFWGVQDRKNPATNRAAARWFKIDAQTNELLEEGVIAGSGLDLLYPSLAVNDSGDVVIGFTGTGANQYASAYAVVGDTDADGHTTFGDLILLEAGVSDYQRLDGNSRNRWGDYSSTVIDPSDPFAFWTFQQYVSASNQWAIDIAQIHVAPSIVGDVNLDGVVSGDGSGDPAQDDVSAMILGWRHAQPIGDTLSWQLGDMNLDGVTDFLDYGLLRANHLLGASLPLTIPEPATGIAIVVMLGVVAGRRG